MADETDQKEVTKAKRGRPRKGPDPEPVVNEEEHILEMSQKEEKAEQKEDTATHENVQANLHQLYTMLHLQLLK